MSRARESSGKQSQEGYALLLVYAMAATIAIMLYMQVPRAAFEAQREKEQLLIDRGEQYSRAVQLFVRKYNRFPQDVAALENTQNIRFLRRKYKDPMTGKEEWREVHVGPGGVFTDSKVYGTKKKDDKNAPQTFIAEMQQIGGNVSTGQEGVNLATRRRASEQPAGPGDPNNTGQFPGNGQFAPGNSSTGNTINGPVMVLPDGRVVPATNNGQVPVAGQQPVVPGQTGIPGQFPGQVPGQQGQPQFPPGFQPPSGVGFQPGSGPQGFPQPGFGQPNQNGFPPGFPNQAGGPPASAANLINQILTSPRPGGLNGLGNAGGGNDGTANAGTGNVGLGNTGTPIGQGLGGTTIGGGFAGVASKIEQEGIKIYKERTAYDEWEFVYDMTKDTARTGAGGAVPQTPPAASSPTPVK